MSCILQVTQSPATHALRLATAVQSFCAVASLEANASDLGERIRSAQQDALREKRQGQKRASLVHLRRVKQFQAARDKRLSSLYTLETALHQVGCIWDRFSCIRAVLSCSLPLPFLLQLGLALHEKPVVATTNPNGTARQGYLVVRMYRLCFIPVGSDVNVTPMLSFRLNPGDWFLQTWTPQVELASRVNRNRFPPQDVVGLRLSRSTYHASGFILSIALRDVDAGQAAAGG